jgi:hypothetical protein
MNDEGRLPRWEPALGSSADPDYWVSCETRVDQFPREVRVAPQLPMAPARYWASVHVWAMYSEANQIDEPSVTAAP